LEPTNNSWEIAACFFGVKML